MRTASARRITSWLVTLTLLTAAAALISGCAGGSLSSVFSSSGSGGKLPPISFAPIIGPPAEVGNELTQQLVAAAKQRKIPVVEKGRPATYTVQGYLAQSNDKRTEKFSYILDVTDSTGNRVHRILGEEAVPAKPGAKPWSSINQSAIQNIAVKTTTDLAAWLPQGGGASTPVVAPARTSATEKKPAQTKPSAPPPTTTTASDRSGPVTALVPPVSGAPGDGRTSLTNALRERLRAKGVQVASTGGRNVYKINGKVSVSSAGDNKERIKIDWTVLSPSGQNLGSVTQQSDVAKGSLDRTWGPAAGAAGGAAAAEIVKLIEKSRG